MWHGRRECAVASGNPNLTVVAKRGTATGKANARRFAANVRPITQRHCRKAQRAQCPRGSRWEMDACSWGQFCTLIYSTERSERFTLIGGSMGDLAKLIFGLK
jgi:hypothetical protein